MRSVTESTRRIRIGIVDDHPVFRAGLAMALGQEPDLELVGEANTADRALQLVNTTKLDVLLVDFVLPGASGISLTATVSRTQPACAVLGLSAATEPVIRSGMLRAGARAFVEKSSSPEALLAAIRMVADAAESSPRVASAPAGRKPQGLTARECEVLELLIRGRSRTDIGEVLAISPRTAEVHTARVVEKLAVTTRQELAGIGVRHGLR